MVGQQIKLSYIIPNWNGERFLADCLRSLAAQVRVQPGDSEVIVIDNGSKDKSLEICAQYPQVRLIALPHNTGFAHAVNLGIRAANGQYAVLLNNDVVLSPDWQERVLEAIKTYGSSRFYATCLMQAHAPDKIDSCGFDLLVSAGVNSFFNMPVVEFDKTPSFEPFGAVAAAAIYPREALLKVGLFEECFFAYGEDTDLACRLRYHGLACHLVREARALHLGSATAGKLSPFQVYQVRRNVEFLFFLNFGGRLFWLALIPHLLHETAAMIKLASRGRLREVLRAKFDFLRQVPQLLRIKGLRKQSMSHPNAVLAVIKWNFIGLKRRYG